ncbi:sugar ABC transporter substrate-binding protein [Terribacillus saccharophilus]|uniref:ABC transporter substrate-binding protein n=1 Tax=Terribacillus saccharophilus TaxID=361277 RepID=UPI00398292CE
MRKKICVVSLTFICCLLLAGCSQRSDATSDGVTTIEVWLLPFVEPEKFEQLVAEFNAEHDDIQVELTILAWSDGREQIKTALISGNGPDVFYVGALDQSYINGALVSAKEMGMSEEELAAYSQLLDGYKVDDDILALPLGYEISVLFYRKDILAAHGYEQPPGTWEELFDVSKDISDSTRQNGEPGTLGFQFNGMDEHLNAMNLSWGSMLTAAGGSYLQDDQSSLATPAGEEALSFMKSFYTENVSVAGVSAVNGFTNGDVAMFTFTQPTADQQDWYEDEQIKDKWAMAQMPEGPASGASHLAPHGIAVNANGDNTEAAAEFAKWLAAPDKTSIFMESSHYVSPFEIEKLDESIQTDIAEVKAKTPEAWEAIDAQLEQSIEAGAAQLMQQSKYGYTERWSAQQSYLVPAITGEMPVEEALQNIDIQVNQAINY